MNMVNFAILAPVGPIQANTMLWPMEIPENHVRMGSHWTPLGFHRKS